MLGYDFPLSYYVALMAAGLGTFASAGLDKTYSDFMEHTNHTGTLVFAASFSLAAARFDPAVLVAGVGNAVYFAVLFTLNNVLFKTFIPWYKGFIPLSAYQTHAPDV